MSFFKRNKSAKSLASNDAPRMQLVEDESGQRTLALGLTWRTIMVAGGATTAARVARTAKASHYCSIEGQVIGYGLLPKAGKKDKSPAQIFPAATLAGRRFGGDAVFALSLSDTEVWIAVIRNGKPSGPEEFVFEAAHASAGDLAVERCLALREQSDSLVIYSDLNSDAWVASPFTLQELLEIPPVASDRLLVLDQGGSFKALKVVPAPVIVLGVLGLVGYGGWTAYANWQAKVLAEARAAEAARVAREENPELVWKQALEKMRQGHAQPSAKNLDPVLRRLSALPAKWSGWTLKTASCKAALPAAGKQAWKCAAAYDVTAPIGAATNAALVPTVPSGFTARFDPTKALTLTWDVDAVVEPLDLVSLLPRTEHLINTASKLQLLTPALNDAPTMVFLPVKVDPPKGQKTGAVIPMPSSMSMPSQAALILKGPLRSIEAALGRGIAAEWSSLLFTFNSAAPTTDSSSATGLRQSALKVELIGAIYAKD